MISGIRTPFDKATGEYQISFVLDENAEDLVVGIRIGSDDDNLSKANISEATMNGKKLPIKNDIQDGELTFRMMKMKRKRMKQKNLRQTKRSIVLEHVIFSRHRKEKPLFVRV